MENQQPLSPSQQNSNNQVQQPPQTSSEPQAPSTDQAVVQPLSPPAPHQAQPTAQPNTAPTQPSLAPMQPQQNFSQNNSGQAAANNAGDIVLQWLTYAFWGWTILAMSWLTGIVYTNFLTDQRVGDSVAYAVAAVLILMPISVVVERFYRRKEPAKKSGAASIVMVIHAVIFALFGIGAVITSAFFLVSMFTSAGDSDGQMVGLLSAMTISVFYAAALVRTLNPQKINNIPKYFNILMISTIGVISVLGIVGPLAKEARTKNDRLITGNIHSVVSAIDSYASENNKLPSDLNSLNLKNDSKKIVEEGLISYKPNIKSATITSSGSSNSYLGSSRTTYYYELCATFTEEKSNDYSYSSYSQGEYATRFDTYEYDKGENCQKLKTTGY